MVGKAKSGQTKRMSKISEIDPSSIGIASLVCLPLC